jgi:uncharacterized membrane protein
MYLYISGNKNRFSHEKAVLIHICLIKHKRVARTNNHHLYWDKTLVRDMMKKSILKSLENWTAEGIITDAQRKSIISFEESRSGGARTRWALYGFLILGISVVGIGIISLIAANWDEIPGSVKIFIDFMILLGVAFTVLRLDRREKDILYDAALSFFALLVLASIGLISQVLHTGGELYMALFFWTAIIFPLSLFSKKGFLPYLWTAGFLGALASWSASEASWWQRIGDDDEAIIALGLMLPFLCLFFSSVMERIALLRLHAGAFARWGLAGFLGLVFFTDIYLSQEEVDFSVKVLAPAGLLILFFIAALFSETKKSLKEKATVLMMIIITILPYLPLILSGDVDISRTGNEFYGALYSIMMLLFAGALFIIRDNRRLFNAMTFLAGIRFLVVYFQVFEDLASTGFGLIFSGMIIIGVSLLWFRQRDRLELFFRKITGAESHDRIE